MIIGEFCSIACGAKFIFTSANHTLKFLSTYPFPLFWEEYGLAQKDVTQAWDNKGGMSAKPIKKRFTDEIIKKLQSICWWNWDK